MKINLYPFLFCCVLSLSCQRNTETVPTDTTCIHNSITPSNSYSGMNNLPITVNDSSYCGYLPLNKKNYWVYLDSVYNTNGDFSHTQTDTLRFLETRRTADGITWWSQALVNGRYVPAGFPTFIYSTDSTVYFISWRGAGARWFGVIPADSVVESCHYADFSQTCISRKIQGRVTVPAGDFSNCLKFIKTQFLGSYNIEADFKPGIGVLKAWYYTDSMFPPFRRLYTSTLMEYHIEN